MKLLRSSLAGTLLAAAVACDRGKTPLPVDSAAVKPAGTADSTATTEAKSWNPSAGPLLLVAGESPTQAFVITPDSASSSAAVANIPHPAAVTLFSRGGAVQNAELPGVDESAACMTATLSAAPPPRPWNVGFIGGVVAPLAMDSVESLSRADSASLVVWMNRLASALPNDSAGRFSGLPFVVRQLWRFNLPDGMQAIVGNLARQINQEATPLQERTFMIAERRAADTTLAAAYSERSYGVEETIQNRDVLAAALLGPSRNAALVISRDFGDATAYGLIERGDDGKWRARWSSARRRCS